MLFQYWIFLGLFIKQIIYFISCTVVFLFIEYFLQILAVFSELGKSAFIHLIIIKMGKGSKKNQEKPHKK